MSSDRLLFRNPSEEESLSSTPISKSPSLASIREGLTRRESYCSLASYSTASPSANDGDGGSRKKQVGKYPFYVLAFFPLLFECCQVQNNKHTP